MLTSQDWNAPATETIASGSHAAYKSYEKRVRKSHIITQLTIFTIKITVFLYLLRILCIIRDLQPLYKSCIGKRHSKYKTVVTIYDNIKNESTS